MPSEDKIVIDGVEYEETARTDEPRSGLGGSLGNGEMIIAIRPKRKQTGWICAGPCGNNIICVRAFRESAGVPAKPERCPFAKSYLKARWQPFYGKVVE